MARAERPKKDLSTKGNYVCQKKNIYRNLHGNPLKYSNPLTFDCSSQKSLRLYNPISQNQSRETT